MNMNIRQLTIASAVASAVAAFAYTSISTMHGTPKSPSKPNRKSLNPPKSKQSTEEFFYRGYVITCTAEKRLFKKKKLELDFQRAIRHLESKLMPVTPGFVMHFSSYSRDQISYLEIEILPVINEIHSWLEEDITDGHLMEPDIEYPLK